MKVLYIIFLTLSISVLKAQPNNQFVPSFPQTPQPSAFPTVPNAVAPIHQNRSMVAPHIQRMNESVMRDVEAHQQRQAQSRALIEEAMSDFEMLESLDGLPTLNHIEATHCYYEAYEELLKMLNGERLISISDAVYWVENAFYEKSMPIKRFTDFLSRSKKIIEMAMLQEGYSLEDENARKLLLHQFMTGRIELKDESGKVVYEKGAMTYDFNDPWGNDDHRKQFVSKLMDEGTGQCHSMPLLYMMLAEEMDVDAWLSFSPNHTFIKLQDEKGKWYNLELTNGNYVSDQFLMKSGFVSSESVYNEVYMDTLSQKELVVHCLTDLLHGYTKKFGYDPFVKEVTKVALEHHPENMGALIHRSNYYAYWLMHVGRNLNLRSVEQVKKNPIASPILQERDKLYSVIDRLGYNAMSVEEYNKWLTSFSEQKDKIKFPRP